MAHQPRKKRRRIIVLLLVVAIIGGYFVGDRWSKSNGYGSLWDLLGTGAENYSASKDPSISISINIDDAEFAKLAQVREDALHHGVIVQPEDPYVNCTLNYNGEKIKAKIRLKGKMTDHVEGDKWSFRILTRKGDAILGMKRFSLMHPGTRNYGYEWIYHQMSREEGIAALRYHFVNVSLNGNDLGVYALEEHFGQEIGENNGRVEGPIFRFNPNLYWHFRLHELKGLRLVEEYTKFQSAHVDPFNEGDMLKDSVLKGQFGNALAMMEAFRRGEVPASTVFDIEKFASRHAILDLVGGQHSADWSDIKFYYNPQTFKVEPLAYESFSGRRVYRLLGHFKCNGDTAYIRDFHDALFNDQEFFEAYIKALYRMSSPDYLHDFFARNDSMIADNKAILHSEFPFKAFGNEIYYSNAELIRENLNIPKFFHAYQKAVGDGFLQLKIGSISAFPSNITKVVINDTIAVEMENPVIIPSKDELEYVHYRDVQFDIPGIDGKTKIEKVILTNGLLGGNETLETEVHQFAYGNEIQLDDNYLNDVPNVNEFPFLIVNDSAKEIEMMPGVNVLDQNLIIPAGYTFKMSGPIDVVLNNNAKIISYSTMKVIGLSDQPIRFYSSDSTGQGILIMNTNERSEFNHVQFSGLSNPSEGIFEHRAMFTTYHADVRLQNTEFFAIKAPKVVHCIYGTAWLNSCAVNNVSGDGMQFSFTEARLENMTFDQIGDMGIVSAGGSYTANHIRISNCAESAILVKEHAQLTANMLQADSVQTFIEVRDDGNANLDNVTLSNTTIGFHAHKNGDVFGPSRLSVKNIDEQGTEQLYKKGKTSVIIVDEKEISAGEKLK